MNDYDHDASQQEQPSRAFLVTLHDVLTTHFNNEELRDLCFQLGIDHERLPPGGKINTARELVQYCVRRGRITDLTAACCQSRPQVCERLNAGAASKLPSGLSGTGAPVELAPAAPYGQPTHIILETGTAIPPAQVPISERSWKLWGNHPIVVAVGAIAVLVAIIGFIAGNPNIRSLFSSHAAGKFTYTVHAQIKDSSNGIAQANISINVVNRATIAKLTDVNGYAIFEFENTYDGTIGEVIIEATGYKRHVQNINVERNALPLDIQLEPQS